MIVLLKRFLLRAIHLTRLLRFYFIDFFISIKKNQITPNTLLIIRLEGIGDYILFRNFLESLKSHPQYSNYSFTLCGNESFKNIAELFDFSAIDEFIWIQPKKFQSRLFYRWQIMLEIRERGFERVIYPTFSRDSLLGDSIIRCSGAKEKIGCFGDDVHSRNWERSVFNKCYTKLINIPDSIHFEFLRNKNIFEQLINNSIAVNKPFLKMQSGAFNSENPFAVICPDALLAKKRWHLKYFLEVSNYLYNKYNLTSIFVGGTKVLSNNQMKILERASYIVNKIGKTTLQETSELINQSSLVISNDTAVSHIGVALDKPVVVISNGEHYGRFTYPPQVYNKIYYAFPPAMNCSTIPYEELVKRYKYGSFLNINTISVDEVIRLAEKALHSSGFVSEIHK